MTAGAPPRRVEHVVRQPQDRFWLAAVAVRFAAQHGFARSEQQRFALALAELVANATTHAEGGAVALECVAEPRVTLLATVDDEGNGIAEPELAMCDGWSEQRWLTGDVPLSERRGLGTGLGAVGRLVDEVRIERTANGTRVVIRVVTPSRR